MKLKKKLMCFFAAMCLTVSSFGSLTVMADDDYYNNRKPQIHQKQMKARQHLIVQVSM